MFTFLHIHMVLIILFRTKVFLLINLHYSITVTEL